MKNATKGYVPIPGKQHFRLIDLFNKFCDVLFLFLQLLRFLDSMEEEYDTLISPDILCDGRS